MPTSLAPPEAKPSNSASSRTGYGNLNGGFGGDDSYWGGDSGGGRPGASGDAYRMAVWLGLAAIVMLFAGLSSAYVFRLGASLEWRTIEMPAFLLPNSCLLLASSVSLELFRRQLKRYLSANARLLLGLTVLLGAGFLLGQIWIWRTLAGNLSEFQPAQLILLCNDWSACCPFGRRHPGSQFPVRQNLSRD